MALTTTTLSSACTATDKQIVVASATGFAAGYLVRVDNEMMKVTKAYSSGTTIPVLRAVAGSAQVAHPTSTNATAGTAADFAAPAPGVAAGIYPAQPAVITTYYSATGAITLPTPGTSQLVILNGTSVCAMTLAVPTKDMDGTRLAVYGNGKAAHTLTLATAIGNAGAGYTVLTFAAGGQVGVELMAVNGIWCVPNAAAIAGTATNLLATIS